MTHSLSPTEQHQREALREVRALLDLDALQREQRLVHLAAHAPQVHAQVQRLLQAEQRAESAGFLDRAATPERVPFKAAAAAQAGECFGPYRIETLLGRGGMGEVWRARRDDGRYHGGVALKFLHPHLLAQAGVRERFVREGRLLARLNHPNIARLLDAGSSEDGRTYFVLELVEGERLDLWCEQRQLPPEARLRLLLKVCAAVSHAHANLVVHRDLKPSNILVTPQGEPKLLDFGIAKRVEGEGADDAGELTRLAGPALTPEYAAPEQLRGEAVTTLADVYALGVVAYRLLTGELPRRSSNGRPTDPAAPPTLPSAAAQATHPQAAKRLRGDLDLVLLKALRPEPARRYQSVAEFAADIEAWLALRPVTARPDSLRYRAARALRRNRVAVLAVSGAVAGLLLGLAVALQQAGRAREEAQRAQQEAAKAAAVKDFLIDIFQHNSAGERGSSALRNTTAEQLLARGAERIRGRLNEAPEVRAELLGTIGGLYRDLLLDKPAVALLREQVAVLRAGHDAQLPPALIALGTALCAGGQYAESETVVREGLALLDAQGRHDTGLRIDALDALGENAYWLRPSLDPTAEQTYAQALALVDAQAPRHRRRLHILAGLAQALEQRGATGEARQRLGEALALDAGPDAPWPAADRVLAYRVLGNLQLQHGPYDEALLNLRAALALNRDTEGPDTPGTAQAQQELAVALSSGGQRAEAEALLWQALRTVQDGVGEANSDIAYGIALDLGDVLYRRGRLAESAALLQPLTARPLLGALHPTLTRLARVRLAQGQVDEATRLIEQARPLILSDRGADSSWYANLSLIEAERALDQAHPDAARLALDEAARALAAAGVDALSTEGWRLAWNRARLQVQQGQAAEAARQMQARLEALLARPRAAALADEEAYTRYWLGTAQLAQGQAAQAATQLQHASELREHLDDPNSPWLAQARHAWALALHAQGHGEAATRLDVLAATALAAHPQLSSELKLRGGSR